MLRWIFFTCSVALLGVGALTLVRAPAWIAWQLAVLAGEYGHLLALTALGLGALTWGLRGGHPGLAIGTMAIFGVAALLLLKPSLQARRIAAGLPAQLEAQFGRVELGRPAFSFAELFARDPEPVEAREYRVTSELPMDFYPPANARSGPAPCVVVVHGGGWDSGDRRQVAHFNHWLARKGYAVAAISYRLAPRHRWPAQREDLRAAITYLQRHFGELGIDPERLVLLGRSAGGQIALATAYTQPLAGVRGVVGLYAPADLLFGYAHADENDMLKSPQLMRNYLGGTPETARENYVSASAHLHASERTPPTLLLHGDNDALVWNQHSLRLEARLRELRVPHALVSLPWATHAFEFNLHGPGGQLTRYAVEWFLAAVTAERK